MPLKIVKARSKKTKNLYIRGSYLGVAVDESCRTDRSSVARTKLKRLERAIELGEYPPRAEAPAGREQPTFLDAAIRYLEAAERRRYLKRVIAVLIRHFGETPLHEIDQQAIDDASIALYPNVKPVTRNTCVHTPMSAILRLSGRELNLKRPKGSKGRIITDWLVAEDAFGIIAAAQRFDPEYATLLAFLLYTGVRLGAALDLQRADVRLDDRRAWVRHQKGQPHSEVILREDLRDALRTHLESHDNARAFRFHQGGHLKHQLLRAKLGYLGLPCETRRPIGWKAPTTRLDWVNHHTFRHTWATWMRQTGTDVKGLVATGNWRDEKTASRYAHAVARDEWNRVDQLPSAGKTRGARAS